MLRHFAAVLVAVFLCVGSPLRAQTTDWPAFEMRLKRMIGSPEFVEAVLDQYRFQGPTRTAMREHLNELYRSDEVVKGIVTEMRNLGMDTHANVYGDDPRKFGQRLGAQLFQSWSIKGLARLPAAEQRNFYRYMLKWMTVAAPADCKQMIFADEKSALESSRLEMKYFPRLSTTDLENYLGLLRKAVFAKLRDFPPARTLNAVQLEIADMAFEAKFEDMVKNENTSMDVLLAMSDLQNASAQNACEAGKLIFRTLLNMKGFAGDLMVLKMVLAAQ